MNKTIGELLNPRFDHYRSIGELSATLRQLLLTARNFRDNGRWGSSGPTEELCDHSGCTGCQDVNWSSDRIPMYTGREITTWKDNHDRIYGCILAALCAESPAICHWRITHDIGLHTRIKIPMGHQHADEERKAWSELERLHGFTVSAPSLNPVHKKINVLCTPQLVISKLDIYIAISVTDRSDFKGGRCRSSWDVCSLIDLPHPRWTPQRESFAAFVLRAVRFYKSVKSRTK